MYTTFHMKLSEDIKYIFCPQYLSKYFVKALYFPYVSHHVKPIDYKETLQHYMVSPHAWFSSYEFLFLFHSISYSKVLKLQKWWSWWWRWWLGNNVITPESLSYIALPYILPTVICRSHEWSCHWYIYIGMVYWYGYGLYILVCPALLPSSLSWRFLNFVFFFRWALKASPKASYQEKQSKANMQICKNICDGYWTFVIWFCC